MYIRWERKQLYHQFSPPSYDDLFILLRKAPGCPPTSSLPPPSSSSSDKASVWRILSKSQLLVLQSSHLLISFYVLSRGSTAVRDILDYHIITFSSSSSLLLGGLFDISISNTDCRYIDTFEKYRYRYRYRHGHFWKYRYRYRYR